MVNSFQPFSLQHLVTVIVGSAVLASLIGAGRRGGRARLISTGVLAFLNLSAYPLGLAAWLASDVPKSLDNLVPLHLCDLTAIIAGFAMLTRRPLLCALTYFWGLAATFQALLTPAITVGFPSPPYVMFFVQHFAVVGAALYLPIVDGWRPRRPWWRAVFEVYGWGVGYLLMVLCVNRALGTNFGFATRPPDNPSLIDHLGAWPRYLFWMQGIALVLFSMLTLPFRRMEATNQTRAGKTGLL